MMQRYTELPEDIDMLDVLAAAESCDSVGWCLNCGAEHDGVEPDARGYECEECGHLGVYGAEEIVLEFGAF